jgi:hypothetical protein
VLRKRFFGRGLAGKGGLVLVAKMMMMSNVLGTVNNASENTYKGVKGL